MGNAGRMLLLCCMCAVCGPAGAGADWELVWVDLKPDADLSAVGNGIRRRGGEVATLAPEGKLLVRMPDGKRARLLGIGGLGEMHRVREQLPTVSTQDDGTHGLGWSKPRKGLFEVCQQATHVKPNELSRRRALLSGRKSRPSQVDNSLSKYFPSIGNQYNEGSCTTWSACYYWNTYTHAADEDLDTHDLNRYDHKSSPEFLFNLLNNGNSGGSDILEVMAGMRDIGCCSLARMPLDYSDITTWPSEAAWTDALRRRTSTCRVIGSETGCSDTDLEAIKQHLANGNAAVIGLACYSSWSYFEGEDCPGFSNGVLYTNSGSFRAGHGLALIGYDDDRPYFDGVSTRHGAFLLANSWGWRWGLTKPYGTQGYSSGGFMWVGYDYFKTANDGFDDMLGMAFYNDDRDDYRPQLYAVAGLNHAHRGEVACRAGIGAAVSPDWLSHLPFTPHYAGYLPIADDRRIAVDLTDGIPAIADFDDIRLFVELAVDASSSYDGTVSSADFFHDFEGIDIYECISSGDPVVTVVPGNTGYATAAFARGGLTVSPGAGFEELSAPEAPVSFAPSGPEGGPFPSVQTYALSNTGGAPLSWHASDVPGWLEVSAEGGMLGPDEETTVEASVGTSADLLPAGTYAGTLTFVNETSGTALARTVRLEARPANSFVLDVSPFEGPPGLPLGVTVSATDIEGAVVRTFADTAAFRAFAYTGETAIGQRDWRFTYPLDPQYRNSRFQAIYLASELGGAGAFMWLALDIERVPGKPLRNWTIRMKHTSLDEYASPAWEDSGWTTVYCRHETLTATGWVAFVFDTPFEYDSAANLMIDFSVSGLEGRGEYGICYWSQTEGNRTLGRYSDEPYDDPLIWSGDNPAPWDWDAVPDIKLGHGADVTVFPEASGAFAEGVWTGTAAIFDEAQSLRFYAGDGSGLSGASSTLGAYYGSDGDGDGLCYEDETRDLDPETPGIQNPFDPYDDDTTGDNGQAAPDGVPDGQNDWDGDGMSNADEFQWGCNPLDADSYAELPLTRRACLFMSVCLLAAGLLPRRRRVPASSQRRLP